MSRLALGTPTESLFLQRAALAAGAVGGGLVALAVSAHVWWDWDEFWRSLLLHLGTPMLLGAIAYLGVRAQVQRTTAAAMDPATREAWNRVYHYPPAGYVAAIRLFGTEDEVLSPDDLTVTYDHSRYSPTAGLGRLRDLALPRITADAEASGRRFFNGPNVRLLRWRVNTRDDQAVALERRVLEITLGPIGWHDYEAINEEFRRRLDALPTGRKASHLKDVIDVARLADSGDVRLSPLPNIVGNAVTLITADGYVAYQRRERAVLSGLLTSAIAENVNRYMDDVSREDWRHRVNSWDLAERSKIAPEDYEPSGVAHPAAAVMRGVHEELSPALQLAPGSPRLLGLCFDLHTFHPDLLWVAAVSHTKEEVLETIRMRPGVDFTEGVLRFVPADRNHLETRLALDGPDEWIPSGKASLVRALEVVASRESQGDSHGRALSYLRGHDSPSVPG